MARALVHIESVAEEAYNEITSFADSVSQSSFKDLDANAINEQYSTLSTQIGILIKSILRDHDEVSAEYETLLKAKPSFFSRLFNKAESEEFDYSIADKLRYVERTQELSEFLSESLKSLSDNLKDAETAVVRSYLTSQVPEFKEIQVQLGEVRAVIDVLKDINRNVESAIERSLDAEIAQTNVLMDNNTYNRIIAGIDRDRARDAILRSRRSMKDFGVAPDEVLKNPENIADDMMENFRPTPPSWGESEFNVEYMERVRRQEQAARTYSELMSEVIALGQLESAQGDLFDLKGKVRDLLQKAYKEEHSLLAQEEAYSLPLTKLNLL